VLFFLPLCVMSKNRCKWCIGDPLYEAYHDTEWGVPVFEDRKLFEFLTLETFQAGLSWLTILRKRIHFHQAFDEFDYHKIALYDTEKKGALLTNSSLVRNRLKIDAAINNAQAFLKIQKKYGSFSNYIWDFVGGKPIQNRFKTLDEVPSSTPLSLKISTALKKEGFKFVGPTVLYAHMQATGMVNDHLEDCFRHREVSKGV
jgi:DNA-3-methyladenine glycosylase I